MSVILISYSFISVLFKTVRILAFPFFISFGSATSYVLLLFMFAVYSPKIPWVVFSFTLPVMFVLLYSAFFSPCYPSVLGKTPVTLEVNIVPSSISNISPVVCSCISCPNAPNILVFGSIKVSVPIPVTLSLTYNPVL